MEWIFGRRREEDSPAIELISGDGELNERGLEEFINSVKLEKCGISYAVVAIMGPQSSGKSTLLNKLFHTNFTEMKASDGRTQTTKGVWMAKARNMKPFTMVLDLEGTDGREREEDTLFEKQSALFALAVSQVVIINMWCHDIGRVNAANTPLLRTIFEVVIRLFSPGKRTLFFVLRDKTKSPISKLGEQLKDVVEKIWETVQKPQGLQDALLEEFFKIEVHALPNYEQMAYEFKREVFEVRKKISILISPKEVGDDGNKIVPASGFSSSLKNIWEIIKENEDLIDIPALKVLIATQKCEFFANEKLRLFASNQEWLAVQEAAETGPVSDFGQKISPILNKYLSEYDSESNYFEETVRGGKRHYLESEAMKLVQPAHLKNLRYLRSETFQSYKMQFDEEILISEGGLAESAGKFQQTCVLEFDQRCADAAIDQAKFDVSTVRKELLNDIETHTLARVESQLREKLSAELTAELNDLLIITDTNKDIDWASVRSLVSSKIDVTASALSSAVAAYELDQRTLDRMVHDLKKYCRKLVEKKLKELAVDVQKLMQERFVIALAPNVSDPECTDEEVEEEDNIEATEKAYRECVKLLSAIAVIRLDERDDDVENVLVDALVGADGAVPSQYLLASTKWKEVPQEYTLLKPVQCKDIWKKFVHEIDAKIFDAKWVEEKSKESENQYPFWVRVGLLVLGSTRFIKFITEHRFDLAVPLICHLVSQGVELVKDLNLPVAVKKVKDALPEVPGISQFIERLKVALKNFYDYMMGILAKRKCESHEC